MFVIPADSLQPSIAGFDFISKKKYLPCVLFMLGRHQQSVKWNSFLRMCGNSGNPFVHVVYKISTVRILLPVTCFPLVPLHDPSCMPLKRTCCKILFLSFPPASSVQRIRSAFVYFNQAVFAQTISFCGKICFTMRHLPETIFLFPQLHLASMERFRLSALISSPSYLPLTWLFIFFLSRSGNVKFIDRLCSGHSPFVLDLERNHVSYTNVFFLPTAA